MSGMAVITEHDENVLKVLEAITEMHEALASEEYAFEPAERRAFQENVDRMLTFYRALHLEALNGGIKRWHEVPKHHYAQHISLFAEFMNLRYGWCYPDEDFMGIMKANRHDKLIAPRR